MEMIEIGNMILKKDDTGRKYWRMYEDEWEEEIDIDPGRPVEFYPELHKEGTQIRIYEPKIIH